MIAEATGRTQDMTDSPKILIVDDEANILDVVELYLLREGYKVVRAGDGVSALRLFAEHKPDLVVLDWMMPQMDGLDVCRQMRATRAVPVIMLTAKSQEDDKLQGLEAGADDYVTKPFGPRELVARVGVVLRRLREAEAIAAARAGSAPVGDMLMFDGLQINKGARQVALGGVGVELTAKEFDLLYFLASNPNQVFTREQLLDKVWDYAYFGDSSTVTVHIRRLREKIERDPMRPRYVKTVWGVGYKFEP